MQFIVEKKNFFDGTKITFTKQVKKTDWQENSIYSLSKLFCISFEMIDIVDTTQKDRKQLIASCMLVALIIPNLCLSTFLSLLGKLGSLLQYRVTFSL